MVRYTSNCNGAIGWESASADPTIIGRKPMTKKSKLRTPAIVTRSVDLATLEDGVVVVLRTSTGASFALTMTRRREASLTVVSGIALNYKGTKSDRAWDHSPSGTFVQRELRIGEPMRFGTDSELSQNSTDIETMRILQ